MHVANEPIPTLAILKRYAAKAREILICCAYIDDVMAQELASLARKHNIVVRFIADVNYNSSPYQRPLIRSRIEAVGTFRTAAGAIDEGGIMHKKLYVFYGPQDEITVFSTSSNFTQNAWSYYNDENPITILTGNCNDPQLMILVNAAEKTWKSTSLNTHMLSFTPNDRVTHHQFGIGEIFRITGENAQVIFGGEVKIVPLADLQLLIDPLATLAEGNHGAQDAYRVKARFLAHYLYSQNSITNEFYDFRIKPVPHQLLALKKVITSKNGGNLLFADDVGLGKTIEAGLVVQNAIRRIGDDARILIMCPAGLKWQWYAEMRDKFGLDFKVWKAQTEAGSVAFSGSFHGEKRLIASYHGMVNGDMEEAILKDIEAYDLVVIDECHKFSNDAVQGWQLTRDLRAKAKVGQLLLLSATPHSGDRHRFLNLLHLLDAAFFPKGQQTSDSLLKVADRNVIEEYVYRNDKLSVTDFDKKPLFRNVSTESIDVELTQAEEDFCKRVEDYIHELDAAKRKANKNAQTQIAFVITIYRKMLASSWKNVFRSMNARYCHIMNEHLEDGGYEPLFDAEEEMLDEKEEREIEKMIKDMKSARLFPEEARMLEGIRESGKVLLKAGVDTKLDKLLEIVHRPKNADKKFIIFTQYVKTLEIIKAALGGKEQVAEIQGSIHIDDRAGQVEKFKNRVRFMVCTEAGGEGINLQFASHVINYDMLWNPARLQQRIGRVWRYGQESDVACFNFYVSNSIGDQKVLRRLNERIAEMVRNFILKAEFAHVRDGLHEALVYDLTMRVLGKAQEDESIESMMGILNEELRDQRLKVAEERILKALRFVQHEQKDLAPVVGERLDEIRDFYAPREIPFLKLFAESIAQTFGGSLVSHHDGSAEFIDLDLTETGLDAALYLNRRFTFEQGKATESGGVVMSFFGFGNDFFNHIIEHAMKPAFGGTAARVHLAQAGKLSSDTIILVSADANSVVTGVERAERYPVAAFISAHSGEEIFPEDLFASDWLSSENSNMAMASENPERHFAAVLDARREKLKSYRNRDFVLSEPIIAAALGVINLS